MYRLVKNILAVLILSAISGSAVAQRDVADIEKMYFIQQKDGESDFTFSFCAIAYKGGEIALSYRLPTTVKINETIIAKNSNEQVALDTKYCSNQGIANLLLQHFCFVYKAEVVVDITVRPDSFFAGFCSLLL